MDYVKNIKLDSLVLVLNQDFNPINIANAKKAIKLLVKKKAEFISEKVIRLVQYIFIPVNRLRNTKPTRRAIHERDGYKCVYCGSTRQLTIDHLIPSSRGGDNSWKNLVSCCSQCNTKKGNRTPEEAKMKMRVTPYQPMNKIHFGVKNSKEPEWMQYVYT